MIMLKSKLLLSSMCLLTMFGTSIFSQTITIDHKTQRFLGNVSDLDRSKYFTLHGGFGDSDIKTFYKDYNVSPGRLFWGPGSVAKQRTGQVGVYPALKGGDGQIRPVNTGVVATDHPRNAFVNGINAVAAGAWFADYYRNQSTPPELLEPLNEPFIHADDFGTNQANIRNQMALFYSEIGKAIHATPELANMKVVGYSSAWPSMELWDFGHWNERMKMFMDVAGDNIDAFSVHLYDGVNVTGQDNFRSGSNSEAILDLIEAYSYIKWGEIKKHAITEYGGIEKGYSAEYSDVKFVQALKGQNGILFNLLERENDMAISIPFSVDKATWHINKKNNYHPYGAALFRPTNLGQPNPTGWVYTSRIHFYELWRDVTGKRISVKTDNPDIQTQAFVYGNKLYLALNNLDNTSRTVSLNFVKGLGGLQNVKIKSLKIYSQQDPIMSINTQNTAPSNISLIAGETAVLEYAFSNAITFDNAIRGEKYYTNKYLQSIVANTAISFPFSNVDIGSGAGNATLRMSVGRKHNVSKSPEIKVNGTSITVPGNWKGYDQANRTDFFGTIEIPVPFNLLQNNNTVNITFPDNGGRVSSLILSVEKYDTVPVTTPDPVQVAYLGVNQTIPGTIEAEAYDTGGQNTAYYDVDSTNNGPNVMREDEGVDIESRDGGNNVGWTANGEWLEYTVNAISGTYDLEARIATTSSGKSIVAKLDDTVLGTFNLPNTGGWGAFQTVKISDIAIAAGNDKVFRLEFVGGGTNINWVKFTRVQGINLVQNFDFETGDLTSWSSWGNVSVASNNQHSGNHAVTVNGAGAASQVVDVVPNTSYTISAWGKMAAPGQNAFLGVKNHDAQETSVLVTNTNYTKVLHTFTTGPNATSAQIYFYSPNASYQVWADDFELIETNTASARTVNSIDRRVKIYPNPFTIGQLAIELDKVASEIKIFDLQGKLIFQNSNINTVLNIDRTIFPANGLYIINIDGVIKKIVVN